MHTYKSLPLLALLYSLFSIQVYTLSADVREAVYCRAHMESCTIDTDCCFDYLSCLNGVSRMDPSSDTIHRIQSYLKLLVDMQLCSMIWSSSLSKKLDIASMLIIVYMAKKAPHFALAANKLLLTRIATWLMLINSLSEDANEWLTSRQPCHWLLLILAQFRNLQPCTMLMHKRLECWTTKRLIKNPAGGYAIGTHRVDNKTPEDE